jgi:hypothetical protein
LQFVGSKTRSRFAVQRAILVLAPGQELVDADIDLLDRDAAATPSSSNFRAARSQSS